MTPKPQQEQWQVTDPWLEERLDKAVTAWLKDVSRTQVQSWIGEGMVKVNGRTVKGNYRLQVNDEVVLIRPEIKESTIEPEPIPLDIRYEDDDLVVVNKPRGLVVHPGPGNPNGTLVNALLYHLQGQLSGIGGVSRPGIVHRIDKDTTGLLVIAKNDSTHQALVDQLKEHRVRRVYQAIVQGVLPHQHGTIDAPIGRDPRHRQQMTVIHQNSKPAVTHFSVREHLPEQTLLECRLETGRTHQIRVHLKYIGFPIVGDPVYGPKKQRFPIQGQALHAGELSFLHPCSGQEVLVQAEPPEDFQHLLQHLRQQK